MNTDRCRCLRVKSGLSNRHYHFPYTTNQQQTTLKSSRHNHNTIIHNESWIVIKSWKHCDKMINFCLCLYFFKYHCLRTRQNASTCGKLPSEQVINKFIQLNLSYQIIVFNLYKSDLRHIQTSSSKMKYSGQWCSIILFLVLWNHAIKEKNNNVIGALKNPTSGCLCDQCTFR